MVVGLGASRRYIRLLLALAVLPLLVRLRHDGGAAAGSTIADLDRRKICNAPCACPPAAR